MAKKEKGHVTTFLEQNNPDFHRDSLFSIFYSLFSHPFTGICSKISNTNFQYLCADEIEALSSGE